MLFDINNGKFLIEVYIYLILMVENVLQFFFLLSGYIFSNEKNVFLKPII